MNKPEKAAVAIFARHPDGRVKTRLVPALGTRGAQGLHIACLESTARLAASLPSRVATYLYLTSSTPAQARRAARSLGLPRRLVVRIQGQGALETRLARAFEALWAAGRERVVIIGSDSPTLSRRRLLEALAALRRADGVLGPARDGGYYLIGLRPVSRLGRMLRGVEWGTARAFLQTQARLWGAGLRLRVLPRGADVDTPADLKRLEAELPRLRKKHLAPLRAWLTRHRAKAE